MKTLEECLAEAGKFPFRCKSDEAKRMCEELAGALESVIKSKHMMVLIEEPCHVEHYVKPIQEALEKFKEWKK